MTALFAIAETFTFSRGFVLVGDIIEGVVRVGMFIEPPADSEASSWPKIAGLEFADRLLPDGKWATNNVVALILDDKSPEAIALYKQWTWKDHGALVEDSSP